MKDINGNELPAKPMKDAQGQPVDHKGNPIMKLFGGVKHGVEVVGSEVKHVAEAPFHKHEDTPAVPAATGEEETPAEASHADEVKASAESKAE